MCVKKSKIKNNNVKYDGNAAAVTGESSAKTPHAVPPDNLLDASIDLAWFADSDDLRSHDASLSYLSHKRGRAPDGKGAYGTVKRLRSVYQDPVPLKQPHPHAVWPMYGSEPPPFLPPWPSQARRRAMQAESSHLHPEDPLGPLAQAWVLELQAWYAKLQKHFNFDPTDLPANLKRNVQRWKQRLSYLKDDQPELYRSVISSIEEGHRIPFDKKPKKFFRARNPPSLALDKHRAWKAIVKDLRHGALRPVNLEVEGTPHCVCPVRTADKNDGTARFVHNSRRVNKRVPPEATKCKLESLLRARNIFVPNGFAVGLDFASGYHCISMHGKHRTFLAFALHVSELPEEAVAWLHAEFPTSYHPAKKCFVFEYLALPFGLSSSCKTFSELVTSLMGFWRICPLDGGPTRVSSYIDDVTGVTTTFDSVRTLQCVYPTLTHVLTHTFTPAGYAAVDSHGLRGGGVGPVSQDP